MYDKGAKTVGLLVYSWWRISFTVSLLILGVVVKKHWDFV